MVGLGPDLSVAGCDLCAPARLDRALCSLWTLDLRAALLAPWATPMKIDLKKFLAITALMSNGLVASSGCLVLNTGDDEASDNNNDDDTSTGDGDGDTGDGDGDTGDGDGDGDTGDGDGDGDESTTFTCSNGEEIPSEYVCDEEPDCSDQSDEITGCGLEAFTCGDGMEIPAVYVCDEYTDCLDGSDEDNCP